ncbi:hypothetical protein JCM6882_001084 [Rhodosporidiobolus microsporus]
MVHNPPEDTLAPPDAPPTSSPASTNDPTASTAPPPPSASTGAGEGVAAVEEASEDAVKATEGDVHPPNVPGGAEGEAVGPPSDARRDEAAATAHGATEPAPPATDVAPHPAPSSPEDLARQLASFTVPSSPPPPPPPASSSTTGPPLPSRPSAPAPPCSGAAPAVASPEKKDDEEEQEEEWPLKEILWPPLPPTPEAAEAGATSGFEVDPRLRVKIVCQNRNGPCSLIALCNILILRSDLVIAPGRESVSYSYLSTLLADYFLRVTQSTPSSSGSNLSLEAALSILPQTRYGLTLNPRFDSIDGFSPPSSTTSSSSSSPAAAATSQGELSLFALARVPLLHGWLADPSLPASQHSALLACGDYDTALEWVVEGSEIAGVGGLEWGEGGAEGDMGVEEVEREVERRSKWGEEERKKVERAALLHRFLTTSSTQLTYAGLFALSSSPLLPPSGLAALFRNSHLSVLYRRPSLPQPSSSSPSAAAAALSTPELFTLVTDAGLVDQPGVVWESLGDTDGEASEFWGPGLGRAEVRDREGERRRRAEERRREEERLVAERGAGGAGMEGERGGADLALAQQLQAEEDAYERDLAYHQQQQQEQQRRDEEHQRRGGMRGDEAGRQQAALRAEEERRRTGGGGRGQKKGSSKASKGEKEKCVVM